MPYESKNKNKHDWSLILRFTCHHYSYRILILLANTAGQLPLLEVLPVHSGQWARKWVTSWLQFSSTEILSIELQAQCGKCHSMDTETVPRETRVRTTKHICFLLQGRHDKLKQLQPAPRTQEPHHWVQHLSDLSYQSTQFQMEYTFLTFSAFIIRLKDYTEKVFLAMKKSNIPL